MVREGGRCASVAGAHLLSALLAAAAAQEGPSQWGPAAATPLPAAASQDVGAPPPTPVPTPSPGLGMTLLDIYTDGQCKESELLYTINFPNADGVCGLSGMQWFVEGTSDSVAQWGAAFCDYRRQQLYLQVGITDQKTCQKLIPDPNKIGSLSTAFSVALDSAKVTSCNTWLMPDPNNNAVYLPVSTRLRPGSCVPPTEPPGQGTPAPAHFQPSKCGKWPTEHRYSCSDAGTGWQQLSNSGNEVQCTVDCLDVAKQRGERLCCYLADDGCFARVGAEVVEQASGGGLAVECTPAAGPTPSPGPPGPHGGGGSSSGGSSMALIVGLLVAGLVLLVIAAAAAWFVWKRRRDGGQDAAEGAPLLSRVAGALSACTRCCRSEDAAEKGPGPLFSA
eukprot:TRINITY_DN21374_c0_g1_i1.p1 TRINITY_DN21374_c0_g1~~TRINITY_DN21374_c0_g1_i1.p1  ORF type:complete len:418 (+),score=118.02 TRINITY_DN21374_c0_g1_i1:84-1256(+)